MRDRPTDALVADVRAGYASLWWLVNNAYNAGTATWREFIQVAREDGDRGDEALAELARRAEGIEWLQRSYAAAAVEAVSAREQADALREALRRILDELGVPGPDYPAPVSNAVQIARAALAATEPAAADEEAT